jgi:outer membrane protein assembly factor BamB
LIRTFAIVLLASFAVAAGCATETPTAVTPTSSVQPVPANSFVRKWTAQVELPTGDLIKSLYLRDKLVIATTEQNNVFVFNRETGTLVTVLSEVVAPGRHMGGPIIVGTSLVFPTDFTLEVYTMTGTKVRSLELGFSATSDGIGGIGNLVFIGDSEAGGRLACVDITQAYNPTRWTLVTGQISGTPAINSGVCYCASHKGNVFAVTDTRDTPWFQLGNYGFHTGDKVLGDVSADNLGVYVASTDSQLYCLDRATGRMKWHYLTGVGLVEGPSLSATSIYQAVPGAGLVCIDKVQGEFIRKPRWIAPDATRMLAEDTKFAYLLGNDNSIIGVDRLSGDTAIRSRKTDFSAYATNHEDGIVFAITAHGTLLAIKSVTSAGNVGQIVRSVDSPNPFLAALVDSGLAAVTQ